MTLDVLQILNSLGSEALKTSEYNARVENSMLTRFTPYIQPQSHQCGTVSGTLALSTFWHVMLVEVGEFLCLCISVGRRCDGVAMLVGHGIQ